MTQTEHLRVDSITKTFREKGTTVHVLDGVTLTVSQGEFVALLGPSGSGKSTLFHMIGGLMEPDAGRIYLEGRDVTGQKGLISYMPQSHALFPWRTVEENVVLAQEVAGIPAKDAIGKAREWLAKVGLEGYAASYPHMLSGGMQQRVSFLRALLAPQPFMCLDEPFGSLDAMTRQDMQAWLLRIWEVNKRSVLFITHSIEEALLMSDRIYVLSQKPSRVLEEIRVPFSRPREQSITADPLFNTMKQEIYARMKLGLRAESG